MNRRRVVAEKFSALLVVGEGRFYQRLLPLTLDAIRDICRLAGAVDVRIREWAGGAVVIPLGKRARPAHPLITQRVRVECLSRKPAGVKLYVLRKDAKRILGSDVVLKHERKA